MKNIFILHINFILKKTHENIRIYFRDMSHLRESLNSLLGHNLIPFYNSYKKGTQSAKRHLKLF